MTEAPYITHVLKQTHQLTDFTIKFCWLTLCK